MQHLAKFAASAFVLMASNLTAMLPAAAQELTRQRALELLEAELKREGPIVYGWRLTAMYKSRTPERQPNIDLQQVVKKMENLIFMNDDEYGKLKHVDSVTSYDAPSGYQIVELRKLWKSGHLDHFDWKAELLGSSGAYNLEGTGVLKPDAKSLCDVSPYKDGDVVCNVVVAERRITAVTGILDVGFARRVEFNVSTEPTPTGRTWRYPPGISRGVAGLVKYDDGWRVTEFYAPKALWPPP
jgi:hypothetical protein